MSILHRRRVSRDLNAARANGGKRKSAPAEYPRASKTPSVPADVKARTWIDPEAPALEVVKVAKKKKTTRRK